MKILTRDQFKEMPKGTVFRKVSLDHDKAGVLYMLDAEDNPLKILNDKPWVVDEDDGTIDYFYITLGSSMHPIDEQIEDNEAFLRMREGEQIDYTHIGERDGLFEYDDIGFAVYTEAEVSEMIERLKCSLEVLKCDSLEKGVTKELSKRDVIHMLRGTSPTLSGMGEAIKMGLGMYTGGMVDRYDWKDADDSAWDKYTAADLLVLYRELFDQ
jgi:hypothetical protein